VITASKTHATTSEPYPILFFQKKRASDPQQFNLKRGMFSSSIRELPKLRPGVVRNTDADAACAKERDGEPSPPATKGIQVKSNGREKHTIAQAPFIEILSSHLQDQNSIPDFTRSHTTRDFATMGSIEQQTAVAETKPIFPSSATTIEFAESLDAKDHMREFREQFIIPSKANLKAKKLAKPGLF